MKFQDFCIEGWNSLWRWNPTLALNIVIATAITALFRFQIAMLEVLMSSWFPKILNSEIVDDDVRAKTDQ